MAIGDPKYTTAQRDAVELHYVDRGKTARVVSDLAAAGELTARDGAQLDPFSIPLNSVRDLGRKVRKRRLGRIGSRTAELPHRDAIDVLRRRFIALADRELEWLEKQPRGKLDPERFRQLVRVAREAAALPSATDQRPPAPGHGQDGQQRAGGATRGGAAGALLKDHRTNQGQPAQDTPHNEHQDGEQHRLNGSTHQQPHPQTDARPGTRSAEE